MRIGGMCVSEQVGSQCLGLIPTKVRKVPQLFGKKSIISVLEKFKPPKILVKKHLKTGDSNSI